MLCITAMRPRDETAPRTHHTAWTCSGNGGSGWDMAFALPLGVGGEKRRGRSVAYVGPGGTRTVAEPRRGSGAGAPPGDLLRSIPRRASVYGFFGERDMCNFRFSDVEITSRLSVSPHE